MSLGLVNLNICRHTRVSAAGTAVCAWVSGIHRVSGVQPEHVCVVVIPQRHDKDHTCINGLLDGVQSPLLQEVGAILSGRNPITAEIIGDAVVLEIRSWAEEVVSAQPVRLDVAAVLVAEALEAVLAVVTAISAFAASLLSRRAAVHGVGSGHLVCLPEVNLCAAASVLANSGVLIGLTWDPVLHVSLAIDELQVMRALGITVSETHLGAGIAILG